MHRQWLPLFAIRPLVRRARNRDQDRFQREALLGGPKHAATARIFAARTRKNFLSFDTNDAIAMHEGTYPVVYYVPRKDVKMGRLVRTSHTTYCPFKGHASYFSLAGGPENAVWSYEQPYDEVLGIKDRLAFYPDKVDSIKAA